MIIKLIFAVIYVCSFTLQILFNNLNKLVVAAYVDLPSLGLENCYTMKNSLKNSFVNFFFYMAHPNNMVSRSCPQTSFVWGPPLSLDTIEQFIQIKCLWIKITRCRNHIKILYGFWTSFTNNCWHDGHTNSTP